MGRDAIPAAAPVPGPQAGAPPPDPLFQGEDVVERPTKRATLLFQFFLFPLLIVAASVAVFLLFGSISGSEKSAAEYLADVRSGGAGVNNQAAQQLATLLQAERRRVDEGKIPLGQAFYAKAEFRKGLKEAFEESFQGKSEVRQVFLAAALGFVGDPGYLAVLAPHMASSDDSNALRTAAVKAVADLDTDEGTRADADAVVAALAARVEDAYEPVRNFAVFGLALRDTPASRTALRKALGDASAFVKAGAAAALAWMGEDADPETLSKLLDPAWVDEVVMTKAPRDTAEGDEAPLGQHEDMRRNMLVTGIRGALRLRVEASRSRVEALARDHDELVQQAARAALDAWNKPR